MRLPATGQRRELPPWLWLGVPPAIYLAHYFFVAVLPPDTYNDWFASEGGLTEEGTVLFLVLAVAFAAAVAHRFFILGERLPALWFGLMVLGCIYFAGEEASWGQHWFGWGTPERWAQANAQAETNLHNTEGWLRALLDRLPRNLLSLGALAGGGLLPLWRWARSRPLAPESRAYWLLPTAVCVPAGLLAGLGSVPEHIMDAVYGVPPLDIQAGEVKELLLALFLLIYALSAWRRLRRPG